MSRRARARAQHPRRVALNAVEIAINRARRLSDADVRQQMDIVQQALLGFSRSEHCAHHWRSLADTAAMSETLAAMGLGSGLQADEVIAAAQAALHDVHVRHAERGTWTLWADEIDALRWLVSLHGLQLAACSYGEFETAYRRTAERQAQALAGNAAPDSVVVVGDMAMGA